MNPIIAEALGSIIRWALTLLVPIFVSSGIWTAEKSTEYIAAATLAILALGWSLYQKYSNRLTLLTALATPEPLTEEEAKRKAAVAAPPVTTPVDAVPTPQRR